VLYQVFYVVKFAVTILLIWRLSSDTVWIGGADVHFKVLVHGQVTIIFVVSVCLSVCAEFFSAVFDPISIKLGHMLYVSV